MSLAIALVLSLSVAAAKLDREVSRRLATARTANEANQIMITAESIRVARLACRIQINEKRIPEACYQALKLEKNFGLFSRERTEQDLDRRCEAASRRLRKPSGIDSKWLSPACRDSLRRAEELLAYKLEYEE